MITVAEAKTIIRNNVTPLAAINLNLAEAAGHILAEDIYANCDIPAFRQSSMDGYALKFEEDLKELTINGEMAAGAPVKSMLRNGETHRIFTGAPLPEGADTVIMQEKVSVANGKIILQDINLKKGLNAREKGSEISAGDLAMSKGNLLTPAAIGFLAGIGVTTVSVFPMPKVAIIVTGKELQKPGQPLNFGQVYESNSYSLTAALKNEGITEISVFEADDELGILTNVLNEALATADVVLLTGGVSVGDYDFVIEASQRCGIAQLFHKVKQKPGKPLYFGKKEQQLVFGLPGNPSSVLSCYYNYVLPALKQLSHTDNTAVELKAELTVAYQKPKGLTHFLKGSYINGKATPLNAQDSYRLSSFAQANCLICLPEEEESFTENQSVTILLLPN
ncbi:gephyrin-like molybdotransferase Glp [Pedobacter frigiditerrae]|uniref:molybdopterin molybdotransferase MoeA n=1 Tax=Pedobacter frigiditerrae TaxID=2530452 RepID=UPI00292F9E67|nr:gephyrin-like molybdotransferase Glp [Pedobacter frigiditerrae]